MPPWTGCIWAARHDHLVIQRAGMAMSYHDVAPYVEAALASPHFHSFVVSTLMIQFAYHLFANTLYAGKSEEQLRKRSWIITTFSALVVSTCSLPFVFDFLYTGMDWRKMTPHRERIVDPICVFFLAYLISDLFTGVTCYRKFVNMSSGWIHHSVYAILCVLWVRNHWSHCFDVAAIMEIPTWIMGIGVLNPKLRSYWAFTLSFLSTRIALHLLMIYSLVIPSGRWVDQGRPSWWPLVFASGALPMHLVWAYKSVRGLRKRMIKLSAEKKQRELERQSVIDEATKLLDSADELEERDALRSLGADISQTERKARARRLVSNAVYKLWYSAPQAWRKAYMDELDYCKQQGLDVSNIRRSTLVRRALGRQLLQGNKRGHNLPPVNEDDEDDLEDWMSVTSMSGPAPEQRQIPKGGRRVSLGKGININMPRELDPIFNGQNYIVSEFPVDQEASGTRRQRLMGQMRRRFEIARRDMVVF